MKDQDQGGKATPDVAEKIDLQRFEEAKNKFLAELDRYPEKESSQDELHQRWHGLTATDMVYAILNFLSLYGIRKPFKKIETTMERVIREKRWKDNPNYSFADSIFDSSGGPYNETMSSWDMAWGFTGVYGSYTGITVTEEEKRKVVFTNTRLWNKRLKKEMNYHLLKFKNSDNTQRLEDVFVVARDVISAL